MDLSKKKCVPCEGGIPPLDKARTAEYQKNIQDGWMDGNGEQKNFKGIFIREL